MISSALILSAFSLLGQLALASPVAPHHLMPMSRLDKVRSTYGFDGFVYALDVSFIFRCYDTAEVLNYHRTELSLTVRHAI